MQGLVMLFCVDSVDDDVILVVVVVVVVVNLYLNSVKNLQLY